MLCDGAILDGRHRARACAQAGVALKTVEWDRAGTAEAFVVSRNLHRRHLNESQRAMVAAKLATLNHGGDRSKAPIGALPQRAAAELLNVSERSVERAAAIHKHGTAAEIAAVERGEAAVSAVARSAVADRAGSNAPRDRLRRIPARHAQWYSVAGPRLAKPGQPSYLLLR